jgi:hypothetical protein
MLGKWQQIISTLKDSSNYQKQIKNLEMKKPSQNNLCTAIIDSLTTFCTP